MKIFSSRQPPIRISVTFDKIVVEHRHLQPPPRPQRSLRFVGLTVGKQTDLPPEIKRELEGHMLNRTIKADEYIKVAIVSTEPGGQPAPIDTDEAIRIVVEEGTIRVVVSPALEADGKRYLYYVPNSAGTNTGKVTVDGLPGEGQSLIDESWSVTVQPASTPATVVGLTEVTVAKQSALPQEIKDILAEPPPA